MLFAYFTAGDAYLIDVRGHPKTDNWAAICIMRILITNFPELAGLWDARSVIGLEQGVSDEERLKLREAAVAVPLEIDGKVYMPMPAGLTTAGTPIANTMHVDALMHYLRALDGQFSTDPDWLNSQFALPVRSLPEHPDWQPFVYADKCGALETQTGCFVPFQALRRS